MFTELSLYVLSVVFDLVGVITLTLNQKLT